MSITVLDGNGASQTVNTLPALGQAAKAASLPVTLASDQGAVTVAGAVSLDQTTDGTTNKVNIDASLKSGTATATTPAMTTTSASILASNANRKGGTIYNPNAGALLVNLAGGNAATAPHYRLAQYASLEIPSGYTGAVTGALESGAANVNAVEFT